MTESPEVAVSITNELGEGPIWSPVEQALYWVDIVGQKFFRFIPTPGRFKPFRLIIKLVAWRSMNPAAYSSP